MMQGFGDLPNGSMAPYHSLGQAKNEGVEWAGLIGLGLIWVGLDFPGTTTVINLVQALLDRPKQTIQAVALLTGSAMVISTAGA